MSRILHIISSSQKENSQSTQLAKAYIDGRLENNEDLEIDTLDLWEEALPEYDGNKVAAKATFFGVGEMTDNLQTHWDEIVSVVNRFKAADEYVLSVPMWNGTIPYKLKHYIDVITQPGLTYSFHPDTGYSGLVEADEAHVFYTSGVYAVGGPSSHGQDFHSTYLSWYLGYLGIKNITETRLQPSAVTPDPVGSFNSAMARAKALAIGS